MSQIFALQNRDDHSKFYCTFTGTWVHVMARTIFDKAGRDRVPGEIQVQGNWKELQVNASNYRHRLEGGELLPRRKPYFFFRMASDPDGLEFRGACRFSVQRNALAHWAELVKKGRREGAEDYNLDAYLHCADHKDDLNEDPDYRLYIGPNGGLRCLKLR